MKASKLSDALVAMTAARDFLWEHVPPGTEGKTTCDRVLFKAMLDMTHELALVDISVTSPADSQTTRSTS